MINNKGKPITLSYPSVNPIINLFRRICGKPVPKFQLYAKFTIEMRDDMKKFHGINLVKEMRKALRSEYETELERKRRIGSGYCEACFDDCCESNGEK